MLRFLNRTQLSQELSLFYTEFVLYVVLIIFFIVCIFNYYSFGKKQQATKQTDGQTDRQKIKLYSLSSIHQKTSFLFSVIIIMYLYQELWKSCTIQKCIKYWINYIFWTWMCSHSSLMINKNLAKKHHKLT